MKCSYCGEKISEEDIVSRKDGIVYHTDCLMQLLIIENKNDKNLDKDIG